MASASASLGVDSGSTTADVAICRIGPGGQALDGPKQLGGEPNVSNGITIGIGHTVVAVSAAQSLPGDWTVGMCVRNGPSGPTLDNNGNASGYVEVVDTSVLP